MGFPLLNKILFILLESIFGVAQSGKVYYGNLKPAPIPASALLLSVDFHQNWERFCITQVVIAVFCLGKHMCTPSFKFKVQQTPWSCSISSSALFKWQLKALWVSGGCKKRKNWQDTIHFYYYKKLYFGRILHYKQCLWSRRSYSVCSLTQPYHCIFCPNKCLPGEQRRGAWEPELQCCSQKSQWWDIVWKSEYSKLQHWLLSHGCCISVLPSPCPWNKSNNVRNGKGDSWINTDFRYLSVLWSCSVSGAT